MILLVRHDVWTGSDEHLYWELVSLFLQQLISKYV